MAIAIASDGGEPMALGINHRILPGDNFNEW